MPDVAKFYGLQINRSGMAYCPFHEEKTPSLKVYDDHFYCFGCGATGDCTGFVAKLFGISQFEAAKKVSYDFGLNLFNREIAVPVNKALQTENDYRMWLRNASADLSDYLVKLNEWRKIYAPKNRTEEFHPLFTESLAKKDYIEYLLEVLTYGSDKEKRQLYINCQEDITKIRECLDKLAAVKQYRKKSKLNRRMNE